MSIRIGVFLAACCAGVVAVASGGQSGGQNITLDVNVTDKAGQSVSGLQEQDFTLTDNKTPDRIVSFRAIQDPGAIQNPPVEAIIVVDEVNTDFTWVANERQQIVNYLNRDAGRLQIPTSLVFFSDKGTQIEPQPTRDGGVLVSMLKQHETALRTINRSQGFYGAGDRFQLSLTTLDRLAAYEASRPGRKLVIWVSPGWPLLSGPNVILTSKQQQDLFQSILTTSAGLRRADITLYSVDPLGTRDAGGFRTFYWEQFTKGVKSPNNVQIGNLGLQVFAFQSGGLVLNSSNDVAGEIATCLRDAQAYYELTIEERPPDGRYDYHAITVKVNKPGLTARTRTGYYSVSDNAGQNH